MEIIVTQGLLDRARELGACDDMPRVGTALEACRQAHIFWAEEHGLLVGLALPAPAWSLVCDGYGNGNGNGYGNGYGDGNGNGYGNGYGDGYGDGYGYGNGNGVYGDGYGNGSEA